MLVNYKDNDGKIITEEVGIDTIRIIQALSVPSSCTMYVSSNKAEGCDNYDM